jgi:hypothetical protein
MKNLLCSFFLVSAMLLAGCARPESDDAIRQKLEVILKDDLYVALQDVDSTALVDNPSYAIVEYKKYTEGKYAVKAVADFHLFNKLRVKMVRKYRYHAPVKKWERYFNEYQMNNDTLAQ